MFIKSWKWNQINDELRKHGLYLPWWLDDNQTQDIRTLLGHIIRATDKAVYFEADVVDAYENEHTWKVWIPKSCIE